MKRSLSISLAAVLTLGLGPLGAAAVLRAGDVAPDFTKTDLNGNTHTLSQYQGKVVVLFLLGHD